jgi:hypothetical protein
MKDELHAKLWQAPQRWFSLKDQGTTKHDLKLQGLRERGDMFYTTRGIIFTGATRLAYEQELKRFLDYAYAVRGKSDNSQIDKKDFRAYMEARMAEGGAKSEMNKIRAAVVKFGALYGKWESFHALSKKLGEKIRELSRSGQLRGPARPHVSPEVRQAVLDRLKALDAASEARTGAPRGYSLVLELQKEASLRSIEATYRFTRECLLGLSEDKGKITILGKGGRVRTAFVSADLYRRLEAHFNRSKATALAPRRAYQVALRRATLAVGGKVTASHAHRRLSAVEEKNARYRDHLKDGKTTKKARKLAVQDTVEHLGHSRNRKDLAIAYLGRSIRTIGAF